MCHSSSVQPPVSAYESWRWALLAAIMLAPASVAAQDADDFQSWASVAATVDAAPRPPALSFWLDVHARRASESTAVLVRPGVGVVVVDWLSLWAGYAWIPTFDDAAGGEASHEHRIWEQAQAQHRFDFGLALQARARLEQRFVEGAGDVGVRARQFVRVNWQPSAEVPLGVAIWDELFVGLNDTGWGQASGFDQNRLFVGLFLLAPPWARLEAGYLFVYRDRGGADLYTHALAINLFVSARPPAPPVEDPEAPR